MCLLCSAKWRVIMTCKTELSTFISRLYTMLQRWHKSAKMLCKKKHRMYVKVKMLLQRGSLIYTVGSSVLYFQKQLDIELRMYCKIPFAHWTILLATGHRAVVLKCLPSLPKCIFFQIKHTIYWWPGFYAKGRPLVKSNLICPSDKLSWRPGCPVLNNSIQGNLYQPRKWLFGQPARNLSVDPWWLRA